MAEGDSGAGGDDDGAGADDAETAVLPTAPGSRQVVDTPEATGLFSDGTGPVPAVRPRRQVPGVRFAPPDAEEEPGSGPQVEDDQDDDDLEDGAPRG